MRLGRPAYVPKPGVTLVELLIAVSMSALLAGAVYFSWRTLSVHVARGKHAAIFHRETTTFARGLANDLKRSPQIYSWYDNEITFALTSGDTIAYLHDGRQLFRNGTPVTFVSAQTVVEEFSLALSGDPLVETAETIMVVRLTFRDTWENTNSLSLSISNRFPEKGSAFERQEW